MFIKIINPTKENILNIKNITAIENILRSFSEGKHIIIAPSIFFNTVIDKENTVFGFTTKTSASEALRSQVEYKGLISHINFYIEIDFNLNGSDYSWVKIAGAYKLITGPVFFDDSKFLQSAKIICENPSDADFYNIIAGVFASQNDLNLCNITFEAINGGGGTTKHVFDRSIETKYLTLCILDNDKKHPNGPLGGTGRQFRSSGFHKTGLVKILDVHEVESLIPFETIEDALSQDTLSTDKRNALSFAKELFLTDESTKYYYDHKKGFDIKKILPLDKQYGDYWYSTLRKCPSLSECECISMKACNCTESCVCYEGFGDNILEKSVEYIKRGNLKRYSPKLPPLMKQHWEDIGMLFFSWSCSPFKKRIRVS